MSVYAKPTHDLPVRMQEKDLAPRGGLGRWTVLRGNHQRHHWSLEYQPSFSVEHVQGRPSHIPKLNTFKDFKVNYGRHWCFHVCISSANMKLNAVLYCTVHISTLDSDRPDTQCLPSKNSAGHSHNGFLLYLRWYSGTPYDIAIWMTVVFHETRKESNTSTMNKHIITI